MAYKVFFVLAPKVLAGIFVPGKNWTGPPGLIDHQAKVRPELVKVFALGEHADVLAIQTLAGIAPVPPLAL